MSDADRTEFDEGRYLFCAVRIDGVGGQDGTEDAKLPDEGIEDGPVSVLANEGVGAVVQPVDSVFESDDASRVRGWLLDHQRVVDGAGEAFGTPLPFRFDTIIKGDDATVRGWLEENRRPIEEALDRLAGRWEYRIEVRWRPDGIREQVLEENAPLRELADQVDADGEGTRYLRRKRYERALADHLESRRESVAATLHDDLSPHTVEVQRTSVDRRIGRSTDSAEDLETVVAFSVLADRDSESAIGDVLESIADRPAFDVRYTGPWPPYSFAPAIGAGGEDR